MPPTRDLELEASIAELMAARANAPQEMQRLVDQQIDSVQEARRMQRLVEEANEKNRLIRPKLTEEMRGFFTPAHASRLPTWIPDTITRSMVLEEMMRCPAGAKVFADKDSMECRVPSKAGGLPERHGLTLWFYKSTGRLRGQRYYEHGMLRWAITYYHTGGRESEGHYDSVTSKQDRENGLHTYYAPNGTIVRQAEYQSGVLQGWTKLWEDDGYPASATRYENGKSAEMIGPTGKQM